MDEFNYADLSVEELEKLANPEPATDEQLQDLGFIDKPEQTSQQQEPSQPSQQEQEEGNKLYNALDTVGIEHPDEGKEYQKLSLGESWKDAAISLGVEASHICVSKDKEWQYESKTRFGETVKYLYRYGAGTASLFLGGGLVGGAIKGIGVATKATKAIKAGSAIQKIFAGTDLIKTGKNASKLSKIGAKLANVSFGGAVSGAIADYNLYRPEELEGHLADVFGDTDNPFLKMLQSDEDDTEFEARMKNVVEGIILSPIMGTAIEFGAKPLFKGIFGNLKNLKNVVNAFNKGKATEAEVAQAAKNVALDEVKVERFAKKADMVNAVKDLKAEADETGQEASQLIIDRMNPKDVAEAQEMLKLVEKGEDIFVHEDGTWDISVTNWEDAYKVSPEEYKKQLLARDNAQADLMSATPVKAGDTALSHQDAAVKSTWTNRGWLGENEELLTPNKNGGTTVNTKAVNRITKNYKDKWQIDNNIKVEFVDGLTINGEAVEGNTKATKYLGKSKTTKKALQNKIDKKQLQIEKIEDKIQKLQDEEYTPDVLGQLQEELRIAQNELKELQKATPNKETISDIVIQIDKNATNPYATFRSELEHARDIAKGTVPNQAEAHFSRYSGLSEADVASSYTYKKSQGRAKALDSQNFMKDGQIPENEVKYNQENNINDTRTDNIQSREGNRTETSTDGLYGTRPTESNEGIRPFIRRSESSSSDTGSIIHDPSPEFKAELEAEGKPTNSYKELAANSDESAASFISNFRAANKINGKKAAQVYEYSAEEYKQMKLFTAENGKSGFALKPDGDIVSVFSVEKGSLKGLMNLAIQNGGKKLDCFDTFLPKIYKKFGFVEVDRVKWNEKYKPKDWDKGYFKEFNNGEPDVVYMELPTKKTTDPSSIEQLQIDFNAKLSETSTPEDVINKVINGEIQPKTEADIEALINKTIDNDIEISGFKWENIAEDSEAFSKYIEDLVGKGEDISAYKEAFLKGDAETLQALVRKEMAATKHLSILADRLEQLGMEAPIEQQRNIVDMVVHLSNYVDSLRSGAGSLLNAQKLVNRALDTFGSMRLSNLIKQGIHEFVNLLDKDIKEIFNLKFTRGKVLNNAQIKQELYNRIIKYGDGEFLEILSNDESFNKDFSAILDKLINEKGNLGVDEIYKEIENLVTKTQYQDAYNAALLAPKAEGKISVIKNWADQQGGIASYYVHNLLSGLGSLVKNIGSGVLNTAYFPARKILGGYLGGGEAMTKEGWNTYKSMLSSLSESWQMMEEAFLKGEGKLSNIGTDTLNMEEGTFRGFHDLDDKDPLHVIQNFHSIMTRAMGATDEFMSQLNYRSICRAKCLNQADKLVELAGKANDEQWINETADRLFKGKFDNTGKPLDVDAYNEAKTILYQNKLDGTQFDPRTQQDVQMREQTAVMKIASSLQAEANKNALVKFIFPFVKTGANILQMNLDHNALYAIASPAQRKVLLSKTPEGALARSQVAFGAFSFLMASLWALNGRITGSAPTDPKERKALFEIGWKPYSVKIGNTYISYQGYEPLHTILGFAADSTNLALSVANPTDEDRLQKFMQKGSATLINNFLDKAAFRTGLKQIAILTDPDNAVDWQKAMAQTVKGFLPDVAMVQSVSSVLKRDATQPKTPYEMIFNNYFNRGLGDYRRDVFGDRQDIFGALVTTASTYGTEPEYQELSRLAEFGYNPSEIGNVVADTKLKFKDFKDPETGRSAYDSMQEELSQTVIGGRTLREAVRELVTSDYYQSLPDGIGDSEIKWNQSDETKINLLNEIFREYNDVAKQNIITGDKEFTDKKGRTIKEAQEEIQIKKQNQQLSNNLSGSLQKIISLG